MRTQVNVYIPDHTLVERARALHINISRFCFLALEAEVMRLEQDEPLDREMNELRWGSIS